METPTTRTDRAAEARAEAERRYPHHGEDIGDAYGYGHFMDGWLAADANPKPRTITAGEFEKAVWVLRSSNDGGSMESWGAQAQELLSTLGIEVES